MTQIDYKRTGKMHSFRGLLADGEQAKIRIQGPVGAVAWRITKLQTVNAAPGTQDVETSTQIFREEQSSVISTIDFTNDELLAVSIYRAGSSLGEPDTTNIIFDNTLFVRNIWVAYTNVGTGTDSINYYIEVEEVKVGKAGMAQLAVAAARRDPSLS